jgi:cell division protein FtsB
MANRKIKENRWLKYKTEQLERIVGKQIVADFHSITTENDRLLSENSELKQENKELKTELESLKKKALTNPN